MYNCTYNIAPITTHRLVRFRTPATITFPMKDPLLGPVAAIAAGILVSRFVPFRESELLLEIAAFLFLGIIALWRGARAVAGICACLGFFFAGILLDLAHVPGPAPEIDATGREIVILGGCVVEPPAISGERERFILELEAHARAQVTLYTRENESLPRLHYGQQDRARCSRPQTAQFRQPGRFRLRPLPGAAG